MTESDKTDAALVRKARDFGAVLRHKFEWINDDKRGTRTAVHDEANCDLCRLAAAAERADEAERDAKAVREKMMHNAHNLDAAIDRRNEAEAALLVAQQERDEALRHCAGPMPSPERIAQAHSRLPAEWFKEGYARLANAGIGHFAYYQAPDACYICTLLGLLERAEATVTRLLEALGEIHEYFCGCAAPGHRHICVAKPVSAFAILSQDAEEKK